MLKYCGLITKNYNYYIFGEVVYYALICVAIIVSLHLVNKKLIYLGYEEKKLNRFIRFCSVVIFPAGYLGSRAASMFYYPFSQWSLSFFIENIISGKFHTYHASLILPVLIISLCIIFLRYNFFEVMDAVFLALPLAHAIGRVGCLVVGCCWGKYISFKFLGDYYRVANPVPLYAVIINIVIFFFLRKLYGKIYNSPYTRERYRGIVFGSYLMLYGVVRLLLEIFRREKRIFIGLTQAQLTMIAYIILGLLICLIIKYMIFRKSKTEHEDAESGIGETHEIKVLLSLAGFVFTSLSLFFVFYYVTRKMDFFQWPFHKAESVAEAYLQVSYFLPVLVLPLIAVFWLKYADIDIRKSLRCDRFSIGFIIVLILSLYYSVDLLIFRTPELKGFLYWPPVLILCVLNAFSEEILFRLSAFNLFRNAGVSSLNSNILQSMLYSFSHFIIAGMTLGIMSFFYGLLLGRVYSRDKSIVLCIICHFVIDIGCIGLPVLRV